MIYINFCLIPNFIKLLIKFLFINFNKNYKNLGNNDIKKRL